MIFRGRLWRHPDFLAMWAGQTVSQFGSQISLLVLPTVVVLSLHGGTFEVGLLTALEFLPFPVLGLAAGVWIDRLRRRPVMIAADVGRALALGSIPAAFAAGVLGLPQLYVVAILTGVGTVFFEVAYQSYVPSLVERSELVEANSKLELTRSVAQVSGPLTAGVLIQLAGAARVVTIDALSFLVSVLSLVAIRRAEPASVRPAEGSGFRSDLSEGLRLVLGNRLLSALAWCAATSNLGTNIVLAVLVVYAYRDLHMSPGGLGIVYGAASLGSVAGALVTGAVTRRLGLGRTLAISILLAGLAYVGMPLAGLGAPLAVLSVCTFVQGVQVPIFNINQWSLRQSLVPNHLQGRVTGTVRTIVWGAMPLGALLGGVLGSTIGVLPTLVLGGVVGALSAVWIVASPVLRLREHPAAAEAEG
jgi:MFS family permease